MSRCPVAVCLIGLMGSVGTLGAVPEPPPDAARIAAIAATLPQQPGPVGISPTNRVVWSALAQTPEAKTIVARAESYVAQPIPELPDALYLEFAKGDGNRSRYEKRYFARRNALDCLMLAEALEWQGRFVPEIRRYVEALLAEKSWTVPAHDGHLDCLEGRKCLVKLFSAQRCWTLAYAATWFAHILPAELVSRIRSECRRRVLDPYLVACRDPRQIRPTGSTWFFGQANWTAVCHLSCTAAALLILEDRRERAQCLEACERAMPKFLSGFTADGYCSEGMGYWNYGFGSYMALVRLARAYTGDAVTLLSDTPKVAVVARYGTGFQLCKGLSPHFADGTGAPAPLALAEAARLWPTDVPASATNLAVLAGSMSNYGKLVPCCAVDRRLIVEKPVAHATALPEDLPCRTVFPQAQVYVMRPTSPKGLICACKGGHNGEFHNHNDVGSYAIAHGRAYLIGDLGPEPYTARTFSARRYESDVLNSLGHPVPRVAGLLQKTGSAYKGKVLATSFTAARDTVTLDLAGAYACPALRKLERTFDYDREKGTLTIRDEFAFASPQTFDVPFIACVPPRKTATGYRLVGDAEHALAVSATAEGGAWSWRQGEIEDNQPAKHPCRCAVTFDQPLTQGRVTFTFTPDAE